MSFRIHPSKRRQRSSGCCNDAYASLSCSCYSSVARSRSHLAKPIHRLTLELTLIVSAFIMLAGPSLGYAQGQKASTTQLCDASEGANVRPIWQGDEGWLFGRPDLITALQIPKTAPPYLAQLAAALKAKGVTPVALVVPTRGSVAYTQMGENPALTKYGAKEAARGYRTFLAQLQTAGFIAPDLLTVAQIEGKAFFFRRDHHWTPAAAQVVARRIAAQLETRLAALPETAFKTAQTPAKTQLGTLQRRAEAFCPGLSLPLESVSQFSTQLRADKADGAALFDAAIPEIVLAGTSNSHRGEDKPELNFDGFLRQATSRDVPQRLFSRCRGLRLSRSVPAFGRIPPNAAQGVAVGDDLYELAPPRQLGDRTAAGLAERLRRVFARAGAAHRKNVA